MNKIQAEKADREARRSLVERLVEDLRQSIGSGKIEIGERLPSEARLTEQYKVSRTVVREAIAALRTEGLLAARQGAGVFVVNTQTPSTALFQVADPERLSSTIELMELRAAVEAEAAALAAVRRAPAQEEAIYEALDALKKAAKANESTWTLDLKFHIAVSRATNNPRFEQFMNMLGKDAIPLARLRAVKGDDRRGDGTDEYYTQLIEEHQNIAEAISTGNAEAARAAMRAHLENGERRYRAFLRARLN